jgi:hypothetical protein
MVIMLHQNRADYYKTPNNLPVFPTYADFPTKYLHLKHEHQRAIIDQGLRTAKGC